MPSPDPFSKSLRRSLPGAPAHLADAVLARLGPSAQQMRTIFAAGAVSCVAAVGISVLIGTQVAKEPVRSAPPELTLFTRGASPLGSL